MHIKRGEPIAIIDADSLTQNAEWEQENVEGHGLGRRRVLRVAYRPHLSKRGHGAVVDIDDVDPRIRRPGRDITANVE